MSHSPGTEQVRARPRWLLAVLGVVTLLAGGCTSLDEWVHNGFKVGPNFVDPPAVVALEWIDAADSRVLDKPAQVDLWWGAFNDPTLNGLVETAYQQNLDLKTAATRVLESQAQRNIAVGNLFPQTQNAIGDYAYIHLPRSIGLFNSPEGSVLPSNLSVWATGFNASWELDFWGRLRRQIESSDAERDASAEAYRDALVTLVADVATAYVQIRTFQQRITYARRNVTIQKGTLRLAEARLKDGKATALDVKQARSSVAQTEASIPPLVIGLRQANNRLCILLGQPPCDLVPRLSEAPIPAASSDLALGIPAELLHRRPDVRKALREAAAQCAQIGVAEADFYPRFGVTGFIGFAASDFSQLFSQGFTDIILPNFQWKILNYGRVLNNVRTQDARFQEKVLEYQQTVLTAGREVEDALIAFLQYQLEAQSLDESVKEADASVEIVQAQYQAGLVDFNRVFTAQAQLVTLQDQLAGARGNIATSLISVYRALGGGWQSLQHAPAPAACLGIPGSVAVEP